LNGLLDFGRNCLCGCKSLGLSQPDLPIPQLRRQDNEYSPPRSVNARACLNDLPFGSAAATPFQHASTWAAGHGCKKQTRHRI